MPWYASAIIPITISTIATILVVVIGTNPSSFYGAAAPLK
jgi:hypothetical protein